MRSELQANGENGPPLFDRAAFFSLLNPTRGALRHTKSESLLLFVSLSNLEEIVNEEGIDAGREALAETARVLASAFRRTDPVAQLSTNLFAILAIGAGRRLSGLLLERMKQSFEIANVEREGLPLLIKTGSAYYDPQQPSTPDQLLTQATRAIMG